MEKYKENINCENAIVEVEQTNNRIREEWKKRFYERFGGEGTIAKTDENCILIAFTKGEVIDFIDELLKSQKEKLKKDIDDYFAGLIAIPDPQATKTKLIKYLIKEE